VNTVIIDSVGQWLPALIGLAAWPLGVLIIVVVVVTAVPAEHQPKVLAGIAELVRAVRSPTVTAPSPGTPPLMSGQAAAQIDPGVGGDCASSSGH
jgi:hypothetical protein